MSVRCSISSGINSGIAGADAQRFLAAVEDQRHDQVLLVIEMADQAFEQGVARLRVGVAAASQRIGVAG